MIVMDMWKPFRASARREAPHAAIIYDKFHILRHLGQALNEVRKSEYRRLQGDSRRYIKGQKYTLLTKRENLSQEGEAAPQLLLKANRRLHKAHLLKAQFGQLWDCVTPKEAELFLKIGSKHYAGNDCLRFRSSPG